MKRLHNFYLYSYRFIGFIFLAGLVSSILWYGFSILFFITDSNWSVPYIISPNQENVLIQQERLLNMEHDLLKNSIDLSSAKNELINKSKVLIKAEGLYSRMKQSMVTQSEQYSKSSKIYNNLTQEKAQGVHELKQLLLEIDHKQEIIDQELNLGLITRQEALTERISLNGARSSLIEAKARVHELRQRSIDFDSAANTLNGAAVNLSAMQKLVKKFDLARQISQLKSDIYSLTATVNQLQKNTQKKKTVLTLMKKSPYILATKVPVYVAFVPYTNLRYVKIGGPVYSCYLDILLCYRSGRVTQIYNAEEYGKHPIFKSDIKGQYIGIAFDDNSDAQKKLLFFNSKPLLI